MTDDKTRTRMPAKSPVLRIEQVRASCGHMTDFEVFDDRKDLRFREQRRAKTASKPCRSCRQKAHADRMARDEQVRQEKAQKAAEMAKIQEKPLVQEKQGDRRLPDGSSFNVVYDATKKEWSGSLTVPGKGEFSAVATGVFRLLQQLDQQYWLSTEP